MVIQNGIQYMRLKEFSGIGMGTSYLLHIVSCINVLDRQEISFLLVEDC